MRQLLETDQKALEINLDPSIYGTFAEIGAGQEVARYFFQVGRSGTIAKTMSRYDKTYSDQIYGEEASGSYVCEARLYKMLDHEFLADALAPDQRAADTNFFVFADTVYCHQLSAYHQRERLAGHSLPAQARQRTQ